MLDMHATCGEVNAPVEETAPGRAPWFKFYVDDWTAGTVGLTDEEAGFYIRLLCLMWAQRGGLPTDPDDIAEMMGRDRRPVRRLVSVLIQKGKLKEVGGKIINGRMYQEIVAQQKQAENASKPRKRTASSGKIPKDFSEKSPKNLPEQACRTQQNQPLTLSLPEPEPEPEKETPKGVSRDARKRAKAPKAEKTKSKSQSSGTRLPEDWTLPDEWREWALINYSPDREVVEEEAARFRDYWVSATGTKARKCDWFATWRNWCRNAHGVPSTLRRRPTGAPERNEVPAAKLPAWRRERNERAAQCREWLAKRPTQGASA